MLILKWFGLFYIENDKIVDQELFPKDPKKIAEILSSLKKGEYESHFIKKYGFIENSFFAISFCEYGFSEVLLKDVLNEQSKLRMSEEIGVDNHIIQSVRALDEVIEQINISYERLQEWYGLHFPELEMILKDKKYLEYIIEYGDRKNMHGDMESIGTSLKIEDEEALKEYAKYVLSTISEKDRLEKYIEKRMRNLAPNLIALSGPIIGAKLMAYAGSLKKLSAKPSSTIQVLGAEKALFRHLKTGTNPPKYGILFQHPLVHRAPYWQRGKIARLLASKIAIAVRMDVYKREFAGDELKEEIGRKIEEIKKKYPKPPKKKKRKR